MAEESEFDSWPEHKISLLNTVQIGSVVHPASVVDAVK
jgi:hypothetical protein